MDFSKIFIKDACPTKTGGQAVMEGVMMRGPERTAVAVRLPDNRIFLRTEKNPERSAIAKVPFIRGVFAFVSSLVLGTKILTYSADVLEYFTGTATESAMDSAIIGAMQNYQYQVKRIRMALAGCEIGIQLLKDMEYFK